MTKKLSELFLSFILFFVCLFVSLFAIDPLVSSCFAMRCSTTFVVPTCPVPSSPSSSLVTLCSPASFSPSCSAPSHSSLPSYLYVIFMSTLKWISCTLHGHLGLNPQVRCILRCCFEVLSEKEGEGEGGTWYAGANNLKEIAVERKASKFEFPEREDHWAPPNDPSVLWDLLDVDPVPCSF